ncbi:hypothetical protein LIA77_03487 [Sarocladium implicatum]|nr:hypothetical protein LIA77_03487 [Sarocladium implicatum]
MARAEGEALKPEWLADTHGEHPEVSKPRRDSDMGYDCGSEKNYTVGDTTLFVRWTGRDEDPCTLVRVVSSHTSWRQEQPGLCFVLRLVILMPLIIVLDQEQGHPSCVEANASH